MNKRKIYIFTHTFPSKGGEIYLTDEIEAIAQLGYDIIYCPYAQSTDDKQSLNKGFITKKKDRVTALKYILGDFFVAPLALTVRKFRYNLAMVKERIAAARYYAKQIEKGSVIYTYWFDELAITAGFIKQMRPDIKWVSRGHGFDIYEEQSDDNFLFFKQNKLALIDNLYTVSKNGAAYMKNQHPRYAHKIETSYLGSPKFGELNINTQLNKLVIVSCAYIRSIKRLDLIMEALPLVAGYEIDWHIIGDGPDRDKLEFAAKELPENIHCIFHGDCSKNDISEIYTLPIDCFINVSVSEGLPVSIMEAISAGIPIIATDVGGTGEIVNESTGALIEKDFNINDLANIIMSQMPKFKDLEYRRLVFKHWEDCFNANTNYINFYQKISD